jgi:hypothetical protein
MAAVEGLLYCEDRLRSDYGSTTNQPWTIGWDEEDTRIRLKLIARAWIASRTSMKHDGAHDTDALARKHAYDPIESRITPPSSAETQDDQSLFRDPTMAPPIDFQSQDGFQQAASKKAKKAAKAAAKAKWGDDEEDGSKKDDGEGSNGGDKGGDTGAGGDGNKKDDTNEDGAGDANPEDEWDGFVPLKSKRKGKKNKVEGQAPAPPAAEKFNSFHEIKLDDTEPVLDLSFDMGTTGSKSTSGFAWGSIWNTGTAGIWDFSGTSTTMSATDTKAKDTEIDNNPWSINRGKPKKKNTGFSFEALDEEETKPEEPDPPAEKEANMSLVDRCSDHSCQALRSSSEIDGSLVFGAFCMDRKLNLPISCE